MSDRGLHELTLAYVECFCASDLDSLAQLLARDLEFSGPYLRCHTAADYLAHLRSDPPEPAEFRVIAMKALAADAVGIEWQYRKPGDSLLLWQHFTVRNGRIAKIRLEFRSGGKEVMGSQSKGTE